MPTYPDPITLDECSTLRMVAGGETRHPTIIHNGMVKDWVGFGWVDQRPATEADRRLYPAVTETAPSGPVQPRQGAAAAPVALGPGSRSNAAITRRNGGVRHQFIDDIGGCSSNYK